MRLRGDVELVLGLRLEGHSPTEIARMTGIPRETVRDWPRGRHLDHPRVGDPDAPCALDHFSRLEIRAYGYLLGVYLGDGCISAHPRDVLRLRLTMDSVYAGIIAECRAAV